MKSFYEQVYDIVASIPYGKVMSYGQIAGWLGNPRGARMVGWAMNHCPEGLPWHRVVMADGSVADGQWADMRKARLISENVKFLPCGRVDMKVSQIVNL
ncbi:MAG: MGMT family protein [Firmicutes bacterium]|nr:MGMT family protein [Bacillota bacterium]